MRENTVNLHENSLTNLNKFHERANLKIEKLSPEIGKILQ
jgi:hypothetical protein